MRKEIITLLRRFAKHRYVLAAMLAGFLLAIMAFDSIGFEFSSTDVNFQFEAKKNP